MSKRTDIWFTEQNFWQFLFTFEYVPFNHSERAVTHMQWDSSNQTS